MHSEPSPTSTTSPSLEGKLDSPSLSGENNGMDDKFMIQTGAVEKLVQEFQQYYNENKDTHYRIQEDTATTSPPSPGKRDSIERYSALYEKKKRGARKYKPPKSNGNSNNTSPSGSPVSARKTMSPTASPIPSHVPSQRPTTAPTSGLDDSFVIDILTKDGRVKHGSIIDIQQQFFKSLTTDLIKTSGSVFLRPITSVAQRRELEGTHPPSSPNSPSSKRNAQVDDDKNVQGKRQMSKTLDPATSLSRSSPPPPLSLLSCSAPAHAGSPLSPKVPTSPTSPSSSPRAMRAANTPSSPVHSRRSRGTPAAIVADMAIARAVLNPSGLPLGHSPTTSPSASPTASPTSESIPPYPFLPFATIPPSSTVSPKPLRPMHVRSSPVPSPRNSGTSSPLHFSGEAQTSTETTTAQTNTQDNIQQTDNNKTDATIDTAIKNEPETDKTETIDTPETNTEVPPKTEYATTAIDATQEPTQTKPDLIETTSTIPTEPLPPPPPFAIESAPTTAPLQTNTEPAQVSTEPAQTIPEQPITTPAQTTEPAQITEPTQITEPAQITTPLAQITPEQPQTTTEPTPPEPVAPQVTLASWVQSQKADDIFKPKPYPTRPTGTVRPFGSAFLSHTSHNTPASPTSPTTSSTTPTTPPAPYSWTSYRPNGTPTGVPQARTQPRNSARPLSTIGVVRNASMSPSSYSPSSPLFTQYALNPTTRSQSATPISQSNTSTPNNSLPPTPSGSRTPSPTLQSSTTDLPTVDIKCPSTPTTPSILTPSPLTPSTLTATTPPRDALHLLPPLVLSGSYSPTLTRNNSPHESPRGDLPADSSEYARRVTESPRGWGVEDIAMTTCWRSPTVSYMSSSTTSLPNPNSSSPRAGRSSINHHRLNRTYTSVTDLNLLGAPSRPSPPESPTTQLGPDVNSRPHAGSGSAPLLPARSGSDPTVSEIARSGSIDQADSTQQIALDDKGQPLARSLSQWQVKNANEYTDLEESFSEKNRTDLIYTHTKAGTKIVKAGTLNALVEVLTYQKQSDPAFVDAFLLTYPSFTTPTMILEKLIERYNQTPPADMTPEQLEEYENDMLIIRLRVCSVLKSWADKYFYDFQNEPLLVEKFVNFTNSLKERGMEKVAGTIVRALQKKLDGGEKKIIITPSVPVPSPVMPKGGDNTFISFEEVEVARQLTLLEYESYCCIRPRECLNQAWNKPNRDEESPNIVTMIRRSNNIPLWVATEIIKEDKLQRRVSILKKFINVAEFCRQLNNFNAVMEIISGLNLTPVYRLRKTWDALPRKQQVIFEQLSALMAPKSNFKVYREELHTKNPPCVPFLGRYLTDLTFIEDAAKESGEGMINFVKRMQLSVVIREIQQYQQTPYHLAVVSGIRDYLTKIESLQEGELYAQSRMLEPSSTG